MRFTFILVKPQDGRNVGSCARSLKTMGFDDLRIVGDQTARSLHMGEKTRVLAHGSQDVLDKVTTFPTLLDAVSGIDLVVATTTRHRRQKLSYVSSWQVHDFLLERQAYVSHVALVFGCESSGLSNEEIAACDVVGTIPAGCDYPSLNLAQAVMVFAYECSKLAKDLVVVRTSDMRLQEMVCTQDSLASLKKRIDDLLVDFGMHDDLRLVADIHRGIGRLDAAGLALFNKISKNLENFKVKLLDVT